jgi:uncharacterized protein YicC (UPF0701 family)
MAGTLVQQRDMYRVLLQQTQAQLQQLQQPVGTLPTSLSASATQQAPQQQQSQSQQLRTIGSPSSGAPLELHHLQQQQQQPVGLSSSSSGTLSQEQQQQQQQQQSIAAATQAQVLALEGLLEASRAEGARTREDAQSRIAFLDAAVTSARDELLAARTSLAAAQAESRFFSDRIDALKSAEAAARADAAREAKRCADVQVRLG